MMSRFAGIFAIEEASRRTARCSTVAGCSTGRPGSDGVTGVTAITLAPTSAMPAVIYGRRAADLAWRVGAHSFRCCATGERPRIIFRCRPTCGSLPLEAFVSSRDLTTNKQRLYLRKCELWLHRRRILTNAKSGCNSKPPKSYPTWSAHLMTQTSNRKLTEHPHSHRASGPGGLTAGRW